MSLPAKAIDRLFERLAATYGAAWTRQWADVPINDVKSAWAHELAGFTGRLEAIAWALENLPEKCPNVIEFKNHCRRAPMPEAPKLPEPKADPERVKAELAKLKVMVNKPQQKSTVDHKAWAKAILDRKDAGARINPTTLRFAQEALRKNRTEQGEPQ
ncbi:MAG: hypothetical protein RL758_29 [Pseudomonadota bacterium]|jgi:hypothetical protein